MLNLKLFFLLVVLSLMAVSCKKENNKNWLVADIYTTDALNGQPISNCTATLCYIQSTLLGSYYEYPIGLGTTDENGFLHVEWERPRKSQNFKITLHPPGKYAQPYYYPQSDCSILNGISVSPGNLNVVNQTFSPYSIFRFHYKNQNCFGANDSLIFNATMSG